MKLSAAERAGKSGEASTLLHFTSAAPIVNVSPLPTGTGQNSRVESVAPGRIARTRANEILSKAHLLAQMAREKRRADRSKSPFSIALFHLEQVGHGEYEFVDRLVDVLCESKRETDVLGYLSDEHLAVLLPDTNEQGTRQFIGKIASRAHGVRFSTSVDSYPDDLLARVGGEMHDFQPVDIVIGAASQTRGHVAPLLKRCIDLLGASTGIVILSPLMLVVAIAIAIDSPGAVIYKQVRLGRGGRSFVFYKFRSMYSDADERVHRDYVTALIAGGKQGLHDSAAPRAWSKLESDVRITRIGRFLRENCIDELPQLFNVLKGDLSLVGPRPPLPYEAAEYDSWHLRRVLETKPGITGLWQVEGRNLATFDDMVRMDLRYIRTWSIMLDLRILIRTFATILQRRAVRTRGEVSVSALRTRDT